MKGGNLSRHKKTKLGMLPGDVPIQTKAKMLEDGVRELDPRFDLPVVSAATARSPTGRGPDGKPESPASADR